MFILCFFFLIGPVPTNTCAKDTLEQLVLINGFVCALILLFVLWRIEERLYF